MTEQYLTKAELAKIQRGQATAVWYNPVDGKIYEGETQKTIRGKTVPVPTYETAIFDVNKYRQAMSLKDAGKLDADEAQFMPWIGEFADLYNERIGVKEAAVITNSTFSAIDTTTVLNRLLNVGIRQFSIPDAVTTIPTDGLEYNIDVYTRFAIATGVPEGVAAFTGSPSVASTPFDLVKDVGHVAATDEAILKARQNIYSSAITNVGTDFRRQKAVNIGAILCAASETNVGDWDAFTSGLSDANPLTHIQARQDAIYANNGNADVIVSRNTGWTAFVGNTFVRGAYNRQTEGQSSTARAVSIDLLPGVTWYIDNELTQAASVIVMDREAVVNVQGPTRVGQYRMEAEGYDGYVARDWYQCQSVQTGKIAELTTVTT